MWFQRPWKFGSVFYFIVDVFNLIDFVTGKKTIFAKREEEIFCHSAKKSCVITIALRAIGKKKLGFACDNKTGQTALDLTLLLESLSCCCSKCLHRTLKCKHLMTHRSITSIFNCPLFHLIELNFTLEIEKLPYSLLKSTIASQHLSVNNSFKKSILVILDELKKGRRACMKKTF